MYFKPLLMIFLLAFSFASAAKGPTGLGKLEIGMPLEVIEKLSASDGVYLNAPMTPYTNEYVKPAPGEENFSALLISPLSSTPLKAVLTFADGELKSIYIDLGDSSGIVDHVRELITAKHGEPKVQNSMKEEQCVYRNGANFKISSGAIRYHWSQERDKVAPIDTKLSDTVIDICESDLRFATGAMKSRSLTIGIASPKRDNKAANPF